MKKFIVLNICLLAILRVNGQQYSYEYNYDNAGNRIRSTLIYLNNRTSSIDNDEMRLFEITDIILSGTVMKLYPNPTQGSVKYGVRSATRTLYLSSKGATISRYNFNVMDPFWGGYYNISQRMVRKAYNIMLIL